MRGLVDGLGSKDQVASPTFTISRHYDVPGGGPSIHHFDFYRLDDPGIMKLEIQESVAREDTITVIEWARVVAEVLPEDRLIIELSIVGENGRQISFQAGKAHAYVLEGLA